jgi:hypothetical protein
MNQAEFQAFIAGAHNAGVLFFYAGTFTPGVVSTAGDALRQRLEEAGASGPVKRKLFSTFVEMAQNILHYAASGSGQADAPDGKRGAIAVGRGGPANAAERAADARTAGGEFWIVCSNPVDQAYVPRITEKLETVRAMSLEDIKKSYKAQLHNTDHGADDNLSRGAGLGLLTMARDSAAPLEYTFSPDPSCDGHTALFYMRAVI